MVILGSLVNGIATVFGGVLGLLFKRRMPNDLGDFLMKGLGLCVILVAVQGMVKGGDVVVVTVLSVVVGGMLGFAIDIDGWIHRFRRLGAGEDRPSVSRLYGIGQFLRRLRFLIIIHLHRIYGGVGVVAKRLAARSFHAVRQGGN